VAQISVTVCDSCGSQDGVKKYQIRCGTRQAKIDLCTVHAKPVEELMPSASAPRVATKKTTAKKAPAKKAAGRRAKVMTMEEIEKLKNS
jgi:hypothetical protein